MFGGGGSANSAANTPPSPSSPASSSSASSSCEVSKAASAISGAGAHAEPRTTRRRPSQGIERERFKELNRDRDILKHKPKPDPATLLTYLPEGSTSASASASASDTRTGTAEAQSHPPSTSTSAPTGVRQASPTTGPGSTSISPVLSSSSSSSQSANTRTGAVTGTGSEGTTETSAKQGHRGDLSLPKGHNNKSSSSSNDAGNSSTSSSSSTSSHKPKKSTSRAATFFANAKNTLHLSSGSSNNNSSSSNSSSSSGSSSSGGGSNAANSNKHHIQSIKNDIKSLNTYSTLNAMRSNPREMMATTQLHCLGRSDPTLLIPQGSLNNSAGESVPSLHSSFTVGVAEDKNRSCRRTMEDSHSFIYNYLGVPRVPAHANPTTMAEISKHSHDSSNSSHSRKASKELDAEIATKQTPTPNLNVAETDNGFFAIYDGHAGSLAADWCGKKIHLIVEDIIRDQPHRSVAELLDDAFQEADRQMSQTAQLRHSGCTAVVAVMRWEDRIPPNTLSPKYKDRGIKASTMTNIPEGNVGDGARVDIAAAGMDSKENEAALESLDAEHDPSDKKRVRMLYVANVGDSRAVICRNGKAVRLTYDHKGGDEHEGRRIAKCGGMILNYRVNGVLAVTRALGDSYMKDLVTGRPYTTETMVDPETDEFLILACDGVSLFYSPKIIRFAIANISCTALGRLHRPRSG